MRHVCVRYTTGTNDIVGQKMLDGLLARKEIAEFYRTSESRWITPGLDPIRGRGGHYGGPERRDIDVVEPRFWEETGESTKEVSARSTLNFFSMLKRFFYNRR